MRHIAAIALTGFLLAALAAAQTPEGPEIPVNTRQGFPSDSQVAAVNGGFVVTWTQGALTGPDRVWMRRFTSQGKPQGREIPVDPSSPKAPQSSPRIAVAAGGNFIIVWELGDMFLRGVAFGRCFAANGKALGPSFRLNPGSQDYIELKPDIAAAPDGSLVTTWLSGPNPYGFQNDDILARRFTAGGKPLGPTFKVVSPAEDFQNDPRVAVSRNGDFIVGWRSAPNSNGAYDVQLLARRFDAGNRPLGDPFHVAPSSLYEENGFDLVMTDDGESLVVWKGEILNLPPDSNGFFPHGVLGQRFAVDNRAIGSPVVIHEIQRFVNSYEPPVAALLPGGGTFVAWSDGLTSPSIIFGQRLTSDDSPQGSVLEINGDDSSKGYRPAVAIAPDGQGIVTWTLPLRRSTQILLRRLTPN